tara:strand:- start:9328 stop:10782 length:1455 start_codon:yes stop_codon:yes gene_type:complete
MSAIPDLLKIGSIPSNLAMSVETGILDPVVQNDGFIRFNMKRAGFLHSNSKLVLSLKKDAVANVPANHTHWNYPVSVGVGSLIERVRILSGNTVIQEIQDWGHLHAYNSQFISNENMKEREQYTTARCLNYEMDYDDGLTSRSYVKSTGIGMGTGLEYDGRTDDAAPIYSNDTTIWDKERPREQYIANEPVFQISLQDLCPFLKQTQLPLFMFEEQLFLEITFTGGSDTSLIQNRVIANTAAYTADADRNCLINPVESKLIIDYITYPNETMEAWAEANKNLSFQYTDWELSKYSVSQLIGNNGFIRNQGGAGKVVNKAIVVVSRASGGEGGLADQENMLGAFEAKHPAQNNAVKGGKVKLNMRYNDEYLYPIDVSNDAYHFNNVLAAEGQPPMTGRQQYSGEGASLSGRKFENRVINSADNGMSGSQFIVSQKLNKNPRINQKGIELYATYTGLEDTPHILRCWLEINKVATLVNGKLRSEYL